MTSPILRITDGTDSVSLIDNIGGIGLVDWTPAIASLKGGGSWQSSALSDGRRLVDYHFDNIVETFNCRIHGGSQDTVATTLQTLRRLLDKARDYWSSSHQNTPVYLEVRGPQETNTRYAIIHDWSTPQDDNPFTMPFFNCPDVTLDNFILTIERGHWSSDVPGNPSCLEISSLPQTSYLRFDGVDMYIEMLSDLDIVDLHSADFTVDFWVRPNTTATNKMVVSKTDTGKTLGWWIYIDSSNAVVLEVPLTGTDAYCESDPLQDGVWQHVAVCWDYSLREAEIYIDGVNAVNTETTGTLATNSDSAELMRFGANKSPGEYLDGDLGWIRISSGLRWSTDFDSYIPNRCYPPPGDSDASGIDSIGIFIWEGYGVTINNYHQGGDYGNYGTIYNGTTDPQDMWFTENCDATRGVGASSCDEIIFVSNKHIFGQIDYIFAYDTSGTSYSENLANVDLNSSPYYYYLFPSSPQAGDICYFGQRNGPFTAVVFDLETVFDSANVIWEYWDGGAWSSLGTSYDYDYTLDFEELGVNQFTFQAETDWTAVTVNGFPAYYIRARLSSVSGTNRPRNYNRHVYTPNQPYIEIAETAINGDLPARISLLMGCGSSDHDQEGLLSRIVGGLRSVSRGPNFTPYLHSEYSRPGISVTASTNTSLVTNNKSPGGYALRYNPTATPEAEAMRAYWGIEDELANQYRGRFRVFLRLYQQNGSTGDIYFNLIFSQFAQVDYPSWQSETIYTRNVDTFPQLYDMGTVTLFDDISESDIAYQGYFVLSAGSASATADLYICDLVLMPVDEWAFETYDAQESSYVGAVDESAHAYFDYVTTPKYGLRTGVWRNWGAGLPRKYADWIERGTNKAILHPNTRQRLWFTFGYQKPSPATSNNMDGSGHLIGRPILYDSEQFYSFRGNE